MLCNQGVPLRLKRTFFSSAIRPTLPYGKNVGLERRSMYEVNGKNVGLERRSMYEVRDNKLCTLRWINGHTLKDII